MITASDFDILMQPFVTLAGNKIVVGVSGGIDSLALVFLLNEWGRKHKTKILAVTVDHKLRKASTLEAAWVKKLMQKHTIEHHILTLTPPSQKTGLPAWARTKRYEALELFGIKHAAFSLFLAHHKDDQVETILMRMMRDSEWRGISGMYPERTGQLLTYFRPLLTTRKAELAETLARFRITECVMDPTNDQQKQGRGFIRNVFIPKLSQHGLREEKLYQLGLQALSLRREEDDEVQRLIKQKITFSELGYASLSVKTFKAFPSEFKGALLSKLIESIGVPRFPVRKKPFYEMIKRMPGEGTIGNCRFFIRQDLFYIMRETRNYPPKIKVAGKGTLFYQGRFLIHYKVPTMGEYYLETLGKKRASELLKREENQNEGVKMPEIYFTLPCIAHLDEVVSAPHLCYVRDKKIDLKVESLFHLRQALNDQREGQKL